MKVCLIVDDYLPDSIKVGAKMMHDLALELTAKGHLVTVITPSSGLDTAFRKDLFDGVTVFRFRSGEIKNVNRIKRAVNETLLSWQAWRLLKSRLIENPHELIVYYSPSIFWGGLVIRLKKVWGARSYLVLRDFFPQWVIDSGLLSKHSPITLYFKIFEHINYSAADMIGIQSPGNVAVFKSLHRQSRPLEVLYNWASVGKAPTSSGHYRKKYGLEGKVVFFYGGNIGVAQDMMNIVRLARRLQGDTRAHFLLVGDGDEVQLIEQAITQEALANISLLPAVSQHEYEAMLVEFDVGLFSLHREHTAHNFPGKLLGYMANRKPILGSVNPGNDVQAVIQEAGAGFVCDNGDDEKLAGYALQLINDDTLRNTMGKRAGNLLHKTFSVSAAAKAILASVKHK